MTTGTRSTVVGVFDNQAQAQQAVNELRQANFREDQIGVVARHTDAPALDQATNSKITEGVVAGAAAGAGVGVLWALGIAAGMLPPLGPVIAGGLLMSVIASAGGGAAVATVLGALIGLGIPEDEAAFYEGEFKAGRPLVTVKANERYQEALNILRRCGAYDRQSAADRSATDVSVP